MLQSERRNDRLNQDARSILNRPAMFMLAASELRYVLMDTKATCIFTDEFSLEKVREASAGLDHVKWIVVLGKAGDAQADIPEYTLDDLLDEPPTETLPVINEEDVALILYTSGTTGKPKGALLTHANLYASAEAAYLAAQLISGRVAMSPSAPFRWRIFSVWV